MATPKEETLALCEEALELREKLKEIRKYCTAIISMALEKKCKDIEDTARIAFQATYSDEGPARETKALLLRSWADLDRKKRWRQKKAFNEGKTIQPTRPINYVTQKRTKSPTSMELATAQAEADLKEEDKETLRNFNLGKDVL